VQHSAVLEFDCDRLVLTFHKKPGRVQSAETWLEERY
jgi:hypothetical protein